MNNINIIIPEVYKNFDVINVSGGTLTFDALNKSFRNYQTTVSSSFQISILSPKPGGDYKLLVTKNTAADVIVSLPINSVLIGDHTSNTITLSGGIGEQFLIEFSYDGINFLFILRGGSTVEPGAISGFSPNVIPFINSLGEWSEDLGFTLNSSRLTHTFTNTDYSALNTGYAVEFKRTANTGLRLGTVGTFTSNYNSVNNVSLIQAQHNNASSVLKINPYGGAVHIGALNNEVIIGNVTDNAESSTSVIISGGNTNYTVPNLIVSVRGISAGLRMWGNGNDGSFFNSMIRGANDNILFNQQIIQIGYSNPYNFTSTLSTNARLEINVAHRTMTDSTTSNQGNTYYQRFSWHKGIAAADRYSYMMIGSNALSTMGMQMKVSSDAINFVNGNLALNPFGGNVAVGFATVPTATLHIKGNSDTVGEAFRVETLTNEAFRVQNDRDILIGGGSLSANTQVIINPYRAAGTSNYVLQVNAQGTNNFMRFVNSNTNTEGGLQISRASYGDLTALAISGGGTTGLTITATGIIAFGQASAIIPSNAPLIGRDLTNTAILHTNSSNEGKFIFQNINSWAFNSTKGMFVVRKNLTDATVATITQQMFEIDGTFNLTNGTKNLIGINYNPTITALSGNNYGLLIRPNTLNGFGLGSTLPTALVDLEGSTTARASLRIRTGVAPTAPNDGDIWNDGTDLKVRLGGTTYTLQKI